MYNPISTYRIQFSKDFTFADFEKWGNYFQKLGVGTIYASPVFSAIKGSNHGYDVTNPHTINPEIGTLAQLKKLSQTLQKYHIGWLQDIVPNHMACHPENEWLMDVLEKGQYSAYYSFFDFMLSEENPHIMLPFLSEEIDELIEKGEIYLITYGKKLKLKCYDVEYLVNLSSYATVLESMVLQSPGELEDLLNTVAGIEAQKKNYEQEFKKFINRLAEALSLPRLREFFLESLHKINQDKVLLKRIIEQQYYRLCHWAEADRKINYRRFFTINGLICLNIHDDKTFSHYHSFINQLLRENIIQGLRVDHIDGLYNPTAYLNNLRELVGENTFITVEKILEKEESLPSYWFVQGTTGYDFMAMLNNLFTRKEAGPEFLQYYQRFSNDTVAIKEQIWDKKRHILQSHMQGELDNLYRLFIASGFLAENVNLSEAEIKQVIGEFLVHCPVYRYYGSHFPLTKVEKKALHNLFDDIKEQYPELRAASDLLSGLFLQEKDLDSEQKRKIAHFYQRCMQFSGPLMAKGVEDTLMYTFNNFIGHNEVGDDPSLFGISVGEFHHFMQQRQEKWPLTLNATATHDTKRGEDVRARLNVLTNIGNRWFEYVERWKKINQLHKKNNSPDVADEYFIYQTLVGAVPMPGENDSDFESRMHLYIEKVLREAKRHSNWAKPNHEYESAAKQFISTLLDKKGTFWSELVKIRDEIADAGIVNSLGQLLLKFTCPGVPDVYQGCDLWDFSLVDPDNRRLVNYQQREQWLDEIQQEPLSLAALWESRYNGQIKLWLTYNLMHLRRKEPEVFERGEYHPLTVKGVYKNQVIAFARRYKAVWYITIVPLALPQISTVANPSAIDWKDTAIELPAYIPQKINNVLTQKTLATEGSLRLNDVLTKLPFALLKAERFTGKRGAGVLMHVSSLPSEFGIGDLGPEAKRFVDFLSRNLQKYWQLLPLNPVEEANAYSPYSSCSSMAGNTLLISVERLVNIGLLHKEDLDAYKMLSTDKVNYPQAIEIKRNLLEKAWENFVLKEDALLNFKNFCKRERHWIDDYALYILLKEKMNGKPWYKWPDEYKFRKLEALNSFEVEHEERLNKEKWFQYCFFRQWKALRYYCNAQGIQLIGDLPFYVSYDSVDVWSNPKMFCLDENLEMAGMAGVPPDYFNADGQLWGMPVYNWEALKETNYAWWLSRIRKNLEMYDLLRLDHFRAFSSYWELPAGEKTAINGQWKNGPGEHLFEVLEKELGKLPFIAEDLGDIDENVYRLRDKFMLPGMRVLQFAFGDDLSRSENIPHNYTINSVVYTGTHDNNTTLGWYRNELKANQQKNLQAYTVGVVNSQNINEIFTRLAYSSVSSIAILPMQDILRLGADARMNVPASVAGNWLWRIKLEQLLEIDEEKWIELVKFYNRE